MPEKKYKKRGNLRDTFISLFILIACVPILALGTVALLGISKSHSENISQLEQQTLSSASDITSLFFYDITETLATNFDTLEQDNLTEASSSWQQVYAQKFVESNSAFLEVSFVDLQGKEIAKYSKINPSTNLLYVSEFPLFKEALTGKTVISDVHTTSKGQTVTIASPSILNGKVFSVVIAEVSLASLITSLEKIQLGNTGYVLLFDKEGTLIGSKNTAIKSIFSDWDKIKNTLLGKSGATSTSEDRYISPITSTSVVGKAALIPQINWVLVVEWPIVESDTIIENFRTSILLTIFISIIIVLLVASFVASLLVRPIRALQDAANEIEKGNFEKQVSITTNNEFEELGESFNGMSSGLKRLEELKNEFVYVAAHELRAPVTAIKGYLELVFDGEGGTLSPEMDRLLSPVKRSNERLVNLVNDLLKVARSEAGKLEITVSPSDIRQEISSILDEIQPLARKRNMTVIYNAPETLPLVLVNVGNFKEIIMNFASNAVKYGNDNGTITVSHTITENTVSTSIADNGRGMSEEDQKHLFQKFFRANDVKKTDIEGTGLGLFITKELVEKMGGTLEVTSTLGVGTTFTVTFKQEKVSAEALL